MADLQEVGFDQDDLWLLSRESEALDQDAARQILLRHLFAPDRSVGVGEPIARGLGHLGFSDAVWGQLAARYRSGVDEHEADGLAVALVQNAARGRVPELVEMIRDPALGKSRILLLSRVSRRLGQDGDALIEELIDDPVLGTQARTSRHRRTVARRARARRAAADD